MKLAQVLLTAGMVTAGIFIYDAVAGPRADTSDAVGLPSAPERSVIADDDAPPVVTLEGTGDDAWRRVMEERLAALERTQEPTPRTSAVGDAGRGAEEGAMGDGNAEATSVGGTELPLLLDEAERDSIDPEDVTAFRELLEHVEQQRNRERTVRDINRALTRLGVELTEDQRRDVIRASMEYRAKAREVFRTPATDDQSRQARRESFEMVREEFSQTIYGLVPAVEAEKVVNGVGRALLGGGDRGRQGRQDRQPGGQRGLR